MFLKKNLDTTPVTAHSLGRLYHIDGDGLERAYKWNLSDYPEWEQKSHAQERIINADNIGKHLSIDETSLQDDLFTILSNKVGHGRDGTIIAMVRGTKAEEVIDILMGIPKEDRLKVKEVTMDLSESMRMIVETAFPNAIITLDCFHIMKRCLDGIEELRLRYKRDAQVATRREERCFKARLKRNAAHRKWYRRTHPKNYKGKTRGPKPARRNQKFRLEVLNKGDTLVESLTSSKYAITQSRDKWCLFRTITTQ